MKRYTSPLTIYIVWHPKFTHGEKVAENIYTNFNRDVENPLSRGIGIPVLFRSTPLKNQKVPKEIDLNASDYNAILVLVDDYLFNDDDWNIFVKDLVEKTKSDDKNRIFPVAFSENAYYFEEATLGKTQFLNAKTKGGEHTEDELNKAIEGIKQRMLHGLCRLLMGKKPTHKASEEIGIPAPIKLFISHAKKDGEKEAEAFRNYIESYTKLNTFFDANDIADGYAFDKQIRSSISEGKAALVVFHTDVYSSREWCQIEILTAKRYMAPIVVVHHINKGEKRSFPYLGNVPTIKYNNDNFSEIIDLTLYQVLVNLYHTRNLEKIASLYRSEDILTMHLSSPPELFNFLDILKAKEENGATEKSLIVLYPDPPLGIEEIAVLDGMNGDIHFLTPIQLSTYF
ncbi:toll/interleukin-1 receptor domain-containing protein [Chitinophaga varians]|uniref:toll/interleukin-1 receptor domain-containing protein n=1 Tax=Chitinophaga varians TaxID=2202339 RepID=UPI00165F0171|nr:toll/interleukin-1 receptor domain-containing protein [Chitinophaga varians]MBC9911039.1 toll/interleukin-1 receptor domain-containing protein [Chitinophaga varians]